MTVAEAPEKDVIVEDKPIFCKSIRNYFREYCSCSSIHGFRYFGEKRTYFERSWWFIVFSLVFAACVYQIKEVYHKWEISPVIVSFSTSETPIYSIPFPAVTICPESKSIQSLYNHTDVMVKIVMSGRKIRQEVNITEEEENGALYMSMLCEFNKKVNKTSLSFSEEFYEFLDKVRRKKILFSCSWMGTDLRCDDYFVPIITDEGICYTFNMLDREDVFRENVVHYKDFMRNPDRDNLSWNLDAGYSDDSLDTYPRRAKFPGVKNALTVTLITHKEDLDSVCKESLQGYRVIIHTPIRFPRPSSQYFRVPLDESVLGSIQPVMISTSDTVKVYDPKRRECYFPSEKHLKYFKIYSQLNCHLECITNFTLQQCNCVSFHMPRENGTRICGASKKRCLILAERFLQTVGLVKSMEDLRSKKHSNKNRTERIEDTSAPDCDCMPICSDLTYSVETSQAKWDWRQQYNMFSPKLAQAYKKFHMSKLALYFKTSQFVTSKRHELYGPTDFLANFGGLLGLFTGFSILSIMEIIYFLTIRLCCNVRLYGRWSGQE